MAKATRYGTKSGAHAVGGQGEAFKASVATALQQIDRKLVALEQRVRRVERELSSIPRSK